jgi:hypothetical protein
MFFLQCLIFLFLFFLFQICIIFLLFNASCWPFGGSQGRVSVQLAPKGQVIPRTISIEHVPSSIADSVSSAPKKVQIWGYRSPSDSEPVQLDKGDCRFDVSASRHVQFCTLKEQRHPVHIVQLRIMSNHGRQEYTCIYRFRVHGNLAQ